MYVCFWVIIINTAAGAALLVATHACTCTPCRYSRVITCKTYLKRLNITQPMAEHLLPLHDLNPSTPRAGGYEGSSGGAGDESPKRPGSTYEQLFKEQITIVDDQGSTFRVQYEGVSCNAQKHLRLTSGWRDYIRSHNVQVGECPPNTHWNACSCCKECAGVASLCVVHQFLLPAYVTITDRACWGLLIHAGLVCSCLSFVTRGTVLTHTALCFVPCHPPSTPFFYTSRRHHCV